MVTVLRNQGGYVLAFCEWYVVNDKGQFEENGSHVWINDIWIHPLERRSERFFELINLINENPLTQNSDFVYWVKDKKDKQCVYAKSRLLKFGKEISYGRL
jgi:hypothetical protein